MSTFSILTLFLFITTTSAVTTAYTYTFLNVSSSLQSTLSLFYTSSQAQAQAQQVSTQNLATSNEGHNQSRYFKLQLHPRAFLHPPSSSHTNYNSLTHSRLARAASLFSKASLAVRGLTPADLSTPVYTTNQYQQSDLQAPVTSGTSQGSGEYFSRVGVGFPAKDYYLVIDTGSDVSWIQCQPCTDCYKQSDPIYNPSSSSSYSTIPCSSPQCSTLEVSTYRRDTCLYQVSYGDGSYTVGDFVSETLSFAGAADSVDSVDTS